MHQVTRRLAIVAFCALGMAQAAPALDTWNIDSAHSSARFKIRHMMVSNVTGTMTGMKGSVQLDDKDITKLKVDTTVDVNTLNTSEPKRDEHVKSAQIMDAGKYPTIAFKSKKVTKGDGEKFKMMGDMTMHGVTKEVTFECEGLATAVKSPDGSMHRGFSAWTKINRKDFGVTWNKTLDGGGLAVGDEVDVNVEIEVAAAKTAKG